MLRSALVSTGVRSVSALLPSSGSGVVDDTRATSTSGSGPVTPGSTATTTVMSGSGPGGTGAFDVRLQLTTDPLTAVQSQPLPSALTRVVPGESSSVTVTPRADDGP